MMSKKKKIIISFVVCIWVTCVISGCVSVKKPRNELTNQSEASTTTNSIGLSESNYQEENKQFYMSFLNKIYLYNKNKDEFLFITDCYFGDYFQNEKFQIIDNVIYFNKTDGCPPNTIGFGLYSKKISTGEESKVDNIGGQLSIQGYACFYKENLLYKKELKGTRESKVGENLKEEYLYVLSENENYVILQNNNGIYKIDKKTNIGVNVSPRRQAKYVNIFKDKIYFISYNDKYQKVIFSIDINTLAEKQILIINSEDASKTKDKDINDPNALLEDESLKIYNNSIYYSVPNGTFKADIDGNNIAKISDFRCIYIQEVTNNKIFCLIPQANDIILPPKSDQYKMYSLDLITKAVKEYKFN